MTHHEYLTDEGTRYRQSSVVEIPFLENRGEPLALELPTSSLRSGPEPNLASGAPTRPVRLRSLGASWSR